MAVEPDIAAVAALIGDQRRAAMLDALLGRAAVSAGELAARAGVRPQTASSHLAKLIAGGLVIVSRKSRMRMYKLAGPHVAQTLEAISLVAPPTRIATLHQSDSSKALRLARTCYDHLAGRLGVLLAEALVARRLLRPRGDGFIVTAAGERSLRSLGIDVESARATRRSFARACLDWSERRDHLAGALGSAIAGRLFELGWIERRRCDRGVQLTAAGRAGLTRRFGVRLD